MNMHGGLKTGNIRNGSLGIREEEEGDYEVPLKGQCGNAKGKRDSALNHLT